MDGKQVDQDPMQMPSWSIGMACAWIATRDAAEAAKLWEDSFEELWLAEDDEANDAMQAARDDLRYAMIEETVTSMGLTAEGRKAISAIEWEDMTFSYELTADGLAHRAHNDRGEVYTGLLVKRADVMQRWPAAYGAAQERGELASRGGERSGREHSPIAPAAADVGFSRKDIHEARIIRDAEVADPGIVRPGKRQVVKRAVIAIYGSVAAGREAPVGARNKAIRAWMKDKRFGDLDDVTIRRALREP